MVISILGITTVCGEKIEAKMRGLLVSGQILTEIRISHGALKALQVILALIPSGLLENKKVVSFSKPFN